MARLIVSSAVLLSASWLYFVPTSASAWAEYGHLTVCDLAYRNLTDPSKEELKRIFHEHKGGITVHGKDGTEHRHYTSFNVGCLEEDTFPRKHQKDHFVNVDRTTTEITEANCPTKTPCTFAAIERDLNTLRDRSKSDEQRVFALMAVGHWIGDIHQPLHISFEDDAGGNGIDVKLAGRCGTSSYRPTVLHAVWDRCVLEAGLFERVRQRKDFKSSWGPRTITYRAVDSLLLNTTLTEEKKIAGGDPANWANESYQITLRPDVEYCVRVGEKCQYTEGEAEHIKNRKPKLVPIDQTYLKTFAPTAQERVRLAGFRLAHLLNQALDPDYQEPIQNSTQKP